MTLRFEPRCPKGCPVSGRHWHNNDFEKWKADLTSVQLQQLKDKARWEHTSLSAVAMDWGVDDAPFGG